MRGCTDPYRPPSCYAAVTVPARVLSSSSISDSQFPGKKKWLLTFQTPFPGKKLRYFLSDDELFFLNDATYVLSQVWGDTTLEAAQLVKKLLRNADEVSWESASSVEDGEEETYDGYVIRRLSSGVIELGKDGEAVSPALPVLGQLV